MGHDDDDAKTPKATGSEGEANDGAEVITLAPKEASATTGEQLSPSGDEDMTLDAFERAVQRAVHDKLGDGEPSPAPKGKPQGADELVASVLSALSGADAKSALDEVRRELTNQRVGGAADNVIDLEAARQARKERAPSDVASQLGTLLKDSLGAFLLDKAGTGRRGEVVLDAAFFKRHGVELLGSLFQTLAGSLIPTAKPLATPGTKPPPEPAATDAGSKAEEAPERAADATTERGADATTERAADATTERGADATTERAVDATTERGAKTDAGAAAAPGAPDLRIKVDLGSILSGIFRHLSNKPKP
ncbi:MAG: hypothetical protein CSA66_04705 [Proteobacteria bacterium]|nr:MAG: hypothetical protein CSA66_04705 [Pseudomonadota bacterium]